MVVAIGSFPRLPGNTCRCLVASHTNAGPGGQDHGGMFSKMERADRIIWQGQATELGRAIARFSKVAQLAIGGYDDVLLDRSKSSSLDTSNRTDLVYG